MSIFDSLNDKTDLMNKLHQKEINHKKQDQQEKLDKRYCNAVKEVHGIVSVLQFAKMELDYIPNETVYDELEALLHELMDCVSLGTADENILGKIENKIKQIQKMLNESWNKFYPDYVLETNNSLKLIKNIEHESVDSYSSRIEAAAVWTGKIKTLEDLTVAMKESKKLISGLNVKGEIINFLVRMNQGRATLLDINDEVSAWLHSELLEGKIKLSFR